MNNIKIIIPLILILLSFVLFVGGTMPYFLFYIFLLTIIIPLFHTLVTLIRLKGSVQVPKGALFTEDKISIEYEVRNRSHFSIPYLEIHSNISKELTGMHLTKTLLALQKKGSFTRREDITLRRRGYYELGEINVRITDVFRLYSFTKRIKSNTSLVVYPRPVNLSTFEITANEQSGELLIHNSAFQDKSRIDSLRDYREGDSVKSIHWKLTAKKDSPIVKEYENRVDTNAIIFIDNNKLFFKKDVDRHLEDKAVDIAISIVNYCLNQNIEVTLETQKEESYIEVNGRQKSDIKPFLDTLARFRGNGEKDIKSLLSLKIETIKKGSTIILITPNLDKTAGTIGIQFKMKNLNPLFIVVTDINNKNGYVDLTIENRLKQEGIPVYILDHNTSIKEALEVSYG